MKIGDYVLVVKDLEGNTLVHPRTYKINDISQHLDDKTPMYLLRQDDGSLAWYANYQLEEVTHE